MELSNPINFIVTRPTNRATNLVAGLNRLFDAQPTIQVINSPLIVIAEYQESFSDDFSALDGVIFISGNAIDQAKKQLSSIQWAQLLQNPLYAIGQQTAALLQSDINKLPKKPRNQPVKYPLQMNSEGFLALPELLNIKNQKWLIVKGLGGRNTLKAGLQSSGAKVLELVVYQRKIPDLIAQKQIASYNQLNAYWLISSIEALNHLYRILQQKIQNCKIIVSSDRIATEANKKGFTIVAQATDASDQQLIKCVNHFIFN